MWSAHSRFSCIAISALWYLAACGTPGYALRPLPRIAAESVGKPVDRLQDAFGAPRKIDSYQNKLTYVWFLEQTPAGAPRGFHGCELQVSVDVRSQLVIGYSLSNLGWSTCQEVERKVRDDDR